MGSRVFAKVTFWTFAKHESGTKVKIISRNFAKFREISLENFREISRNFVEKPFREISRNKPTMRGCAKYRPFRGQS